MTALLVSSHWVQYHARSMRRFYSRSRFIPIHHEYLLIWERSARTLVQVTLVEGLRELNRARRRAGDPLFDWL